MTLVLDDTTRGHLASVMRETGATSAAEAVRRALCLWDYLLARRAAGDVLVSRGPGGDKELVLL